MAESKLRIFLGQHEPAGINRCYGSMTYQGVEVVRVYAGDMKTARSDLMEVALESLLEKTLELDRRITIGNEYVERLHAEIVDLKKERDDAKRVSTHSDGVASHYKKACEKAEWIAEERRLAYLEQVDYIEYLRGRLTKKRVKFTDEDAFSQMRELSVDHQPK